ncbi:DUF5133 domain-containing protein [Streptomyces sp. PR69]|uniref:DUF5133 domain-containing protein n=1 Tax=Streptomyces sp. PR69 TaxID=2984950 RepID=UPI00226448B5|nr:DUF5133 domain-containing protein [Streptomyces sp. PR69]
MLLPDKALLSALLHRYRAWECLAEAEPRDPHTRRRRDDLAYTLCVLMGRRTPQEAVAEAEAYLGAARPRSSGPF